MSSQRKHTTLWYTEETWKIISKKSEELYPGKGVGHMINVSLQKEILRSKDTCFPCIFEKPEKMQFHYAIPENLVEGVMCLCIRWGIAPAALISRVAIEPHLIGE